MFNEQDVVPYLVRRGLLPTRAVVEDGLVVISTLRRNRHYHVVPRTGPAYLIKQGNGPEGFGSLAYEASAYAFLSSLSGPRLRRSLAAVYGYDPDDVLLTLELLPAARNLREYHAARHRFSATIAASLGRVLADLHRSGRARVPEALDAGLAPDPPLLLSLHDPTVDLFQSVSAGNVALIQTIQRFAGLCAHFDLLRAGWAPNTVLHGDLRWDNCLLVGGRASGRSPDNLRLVDWELSRVGDPYWDVGYVFGEYLGYWVLSIPVVRGLEMNDLVERCAFGIDRLHPALRSFWSSYVDELGLDDDEAASALGRAVTYAAARLVELGCEQMHGATELTPSVIFCIQLALNVLERPEEAAKGLLGIDGVVGNFPRRRAAASVG